MKTINQWNGFVDSRPSCIEMYKEMCKPENYYAQNNWRYKEFKFVHGYRTILGNYIFGQAEAEKNYFLHGKRNPIPYRVTHKYIDINIDDYRFRCSARIDGLSSKFVFKMEQTTFAPMKDINPFVVKSNDPMDMFDLERYFKTFLLPKYLFPEGLFRNIQLLFNCSKKEAVEKYKEHKGYVSESDRIRIARGILKRKNIYLPSHCDVEFAEKAVIACINHPRYKKRKEVEKAISPWELMEDLTYQFDDDEDIINAAEEYYLDTNKILI